MSKRELKKQVFKNVVSGDSENIAKLLSDFHYSKEKTQQVLNKYKKLLIK